MKSLLIVLLTVCVISCSTDSTSNDRQRISDEQLVSLLVDLHLADAARGSNELADVVTSGVTGTDYDAVLLKHNISASDFKETMGYFAAHPEELANLYDGVIEKLTALQGKSVQ